MADWVFIVSRTEPKTYMEIRHVFPDENRDVRVILDRRGRERRRSERAVPTERRYTERRLRDVTWELRSSGWAVVRRDRNQLTPDATRCVEPRCREEGVVGLNGAWLCLTHFDIRFTAIGKTPLDQASSSRADPCGPLAAARDDEGLGVSGSGTPVKDEKAASGRTRRPS